MAEPPQALTLAHNRDDRHLTELYVRWGVLTALLVLITAGLLNVFGQRPDRTVASGGGATLTVSAPTALRGGLFYMGRFKITAEDEIESATLVLEKGWLESMHINTIEPAPVGEASRGGDLALDFGHVPAGDTVTAYLQFQVNPTNVGRRSQDVRLYDDEELLAVSQRTVTIFP